MTERRFLPNIENRGVRLEKRAGDEDTLPRIVGTSAVFYNAADPDGTQYRLWRDTWERIKPGAFDRAIKEDDVRGLFNHNASSILGRNMSDTLSLSVDAAGLNYDIDTPDTGVGRDTVTSLTRGDIDGSSFGFRALKSSWEEHTDPDTDVTVYIRNIEEVELFDVGPVTYPAYAGTTSGTRSQRSPSWMQRCEARSDYRSGSSAEADQILKELTDWMGKRDAVRFARQRRLRMLEL